MCAVLSIATSTRGKNTIILPTSILKQKEKRKRLLRPLIIFTTMRFNYLFVAALGSVVFVLCVRPARGLPLELSVFDLDVAARRAVRRVVQAAHLGLDLHHVGGGRRPNLDLVHGN